MTKQRNPQAEQMADESMVRNLAAQAEAIWPQEQALFARYGLAGDCRIADIGCGTGEITVRLAASYSRSEVVGVDLLEELVDHARRRHAALAPRVRFEQGDAFELGLPSAYFDLVVCRHMTQLVPEPEKVLSELDRICKPGGWLHVLSEDYGMLHMIPGAVDPDRLWHEGAIAYLRDIHTDGRIGRRTYALLKQLGLQDLHVDYVTVDTLCVPRETFASIMEAWRDGYAEVISKHTALGLEETHALFDHVSASIRNPDHYAVWQVPVISGKRAPSPPPFPRPRGRGSENNALPQAGEENAMTAEPGVILDFWFADAAESAAALQRQAKLWFGIEQSDAEITAQDERIRHRFEVVVDQASRGELNEWAATPRGRLALIILLDQFRRCIYRGTAEAFASDGAALELTCQSMAIGADRLLTSLERLFFYMPLQHAESLAVQEKSVAAFSSLSSQAGDQEKPFVDSCLPYALVHRGIIRRFGRFPHRNAIVGRESTPAERAYLAGDVPDFGQRK